MSKTSRSPRAAGLVLLLCAALGTPLQAQAHQEKYDEVDPWVGFEPREPGPDSAAVARFLTALAASDPVVCQLAVSSIGNNWYGWDDYQTGQLAGEAASERARQALSRPVTEPGVLARLAESLGDQHTCIRRAACSWR
jgi:hypothetical protein